MHQTALLALLFCGSCGAAVNLVEPLSNGLALNMTADEITSKFGPPTERAPDGSTFGYPGFAVRVGGARQEIRRLTLKQNVRLSCGIGPGSSRINVIRTFSAPLIATSGQYRLTFEYKDDRVVSIRIEPVAAHFAPAAKDDAATPPPPSNKGLAGTWYGTGSTVGMIEILPGGTYKWNGNSGKWSRRGNQVVFSGPLESWNHGHANVKNGSLEFRWTTPEGAKEDYAFARY